MSCSNETCWSSNASGSQSNHFCPEDSSFQYSQPKGPPVFNDQPNLLDTRVQCVASLKGDNAYPSSLLLAGKFLFTGSSDGEIRSWRRNRFTSESGHEYPAYNTVMAGKGAVKSLVVFADKVFSAHQDHKIRVWKIDIDETENGKLTHVATLPRLCDRALKFLIPKNHVQIRRHKKTTWVHHVDTVSALAVSSDESLLYSVSWDRTIKIWRTTDFTCLESITKAHDDAINAVALSIDGYVYTGSADKKIKVWRQNTEEGKHFLVSTLVKHDHGVNALALAADGCRLYSGGADGSIVAWEKIHGGDMVVVGALQGHTMSILCLVVISDLVCSGSADKTVRIWRGEEGCYSCLATLEGHNGPVKCLTVANDQIKPSDLTTSYILYSGSLDCETKVWQIFVPIV